MAITKDTVKTKFANKLGKVNAPKTFKDNLINQISEKVKDDEDENQLDSLLDLYEPIIKESAAEFDRVRTKATTDAKNALIVPEKETDTEIELPADTPEYVKTIMKQNQQIQAELKELKTSQTAKTLTERFNTDVRVAKIPAFMRTGFVPKTEEEFESNIETLTGEYSKFAQENKIAIVGNDVPEGTGGGSTVGQKAVEAAVKDWGAAKVAAESPKDSK